jgi:hypothetical protein
MIEKNFTFDSRKELLPPRKTIRSPKKLSPRKRSPRRLTSPESIYRSPRKTYRLQPKPQQLKFD